MKQSYLEVTYRKGRPLAAYYHLPRRAGDKSVRTEEVGHGLVVDFAPDGRVIGIEITTPSQLRLAELNDVLVRAGENPVPAEDLAPLLAA